MFTQTDTKVVPLTKDFASYFSGLPSKKGDRDRETRAGKRRIAWLSRLMRDGLFHSPKWATANLGDVIYRVNGGHSSLMLCEQNGEFPKGLVAVVDEFTCETMSDLADLFDQFDNSRSSRTHKEKVSSHKALYESLDDVSPTDCANALRGIAYFMSGCGEERRLDADERVRLISSNEEYLAWSAKFSRNKFLRRTGIGAAIYNSYLRDGSAAHDFWIYVSEESHPDNTHITRVLAKTLRQATSTAASGERNPLHQLTPRGFYVKCTHAWNAWRDGRNIRSLKYHAKSPLPHMK